MRITLDLGNSSFSYQPENSSLQIIPWSEAEHQLSTFFSPNDDLLYVSVNREKEALLRQHYPNACKVGVDRPYPLQLLVADTVGGDRILAAYGAYLQKHSAAIAISCGTALTINAVNAQKEFLGGLIFPGPRLLSQSLHDYCSLLPRVYPVQNTQEFLGKTTEEAIQVGISQGIRGLVEREIQGLQQQVFGQKVPVYATGGAALPFLASLDIPFIPDLIHQGLKDLFDEHN